MNVETVRLILEPFNDSHYEGLRVMDSDAEVMRYINRGIVKTPEETWEGIRRVQARWDKYHFSWWAIREKSSGAIVDYAVERVGASYLVAVADPENIASQRVMKRVGMSYKAIERHYDTECVVYELNMSKPA